MIEQSPQSDQEQRSRVPFIPSPPESHIRKRRIRRRIYIALLAVLVLGGIGGGIYWILQRQSEQSETTLQQSDEQSDPLAIETDPKSLRIIAAGDFIPHDAINVRAKKSNGDYDYYTMMSNMKPYFDRADVRFCNQAVPGGGERFGISGYPVFNSPTEFARDMQKLGCNVINTGTNHTNDKGQPVIDAMLASWDSLPDILAVAGANSSAEEQQAVRYFEAKGVKFAFLSYSSYTNLPNEFPYSLNGFDEALMQRQLTEARQQADIVMVSARWGTEYSQGINAHQDLWSQKLADMGADVVLGHGPHVLEPFRKLTAQDGREVFVWFSLGNFLNAQLEIEALFNGLAVMDVDTSTKRITEVSFLPLYMHYEWTERERAAENLLARRNFSMYPIDEAEEPLARSQLNTTVSEQLLRITELLNSYDEVMILSSKEY